MLSEERTYLSVAYADKEQAKQRGARWDPARKRWYVESGVALAPFSAWLPAEMRAGLGREESSEGMELALAKPAPIPGISLSQLTAQVGAAVSALPKSQWVRAEIGQWRTTGGGHVSMELVEYGVQGTLVARLQGFLWRDRASAMVQAFEVATGARLAEGIKILVRVSLDSSPQYGIRATVEDIDPSYTMGELAANLREIREFLKREGLYDRNLSLPQPLEFCRVAVVSPQDAAGLGDFQRDAERLEANGVCRFEYYTARFQGKEARASLLSVLARVAADHAAGTGFDALCLIRGGGAATDLSWLNDSDVAQAVCLMPIPVITGIGHERDNTILDEVARVRKDTPSKVIGHIESTVRANATRALENMQAILALTDSAMALHASRVEQCAAVIREETQKRLWITETSVDSLWIRVKDASALALERADSAVEEMQEAVIRTAAGLLDSAERAVASLGREVVGLGPQATLQRGFALVRDDQGRPVASAEAARQAKSLQLEFRDGVVACKTTRT